MIGQIVIFEGEEGTEGGGRVEKKREEEEGRDERGQRGAGRESRIRDRLQMITAESIVRWQRDKGAPRTQKERPVNPSGRARVWVLLTV